MTQTRKERRAADQAEYEASLQRAAEAQEDQRARAALPPAPSLGQAGILGLALGPLGWAAGTAIDARDAQKRLAENRPTIPPRPD